NNGLWTTCETTLRSCASSPTSWGRGCEQRGSILDRSSRRHCAGRNDRALIDLHPMSRIESLPRRGWRETADVQGMTRMLRTSAGTQTLRPIQAAALKEAAECQGLMLIARV